MSDSIPQLPVFWHSLWESKILKTFNVTNVDLEICTHVPQNHQISQYLCNKLHKKNDPKTLSSLTTTLPGQIWICFVISQLFYTGKEINFLVILLYCIIHCIVTCKHLHWKFFIVWYTFHSTGFKKDWEVHSGAEPNCVCAPWSYVGGSSGTGLTNSEWQL